MAGQNPTDSGTRGLFDVLPPDEAVKFIANPKGYSQARVSDDFIENIRTVSQLYDIIQKLLKNAKKETQYPETGILTSELQLHKRAINDKSPVPPGEKINSILLQMAMTSPPLIHIIREMLPGKTGSKPEFKSLVVAPIEEQPDKVSLAYRNCLRNSVIAFKSVWAQDSDLPIPSVEKNSVSNINVRTGRIEDLLSQMTLPPEWTGSDFKNLSNLFRKFNEGLRIRLFRPLVLDLLREKMVMNFSCDDLRKQSGARLPDIVLPNNSKYLYKRYAILKEMILSDRMLSVFPEEERAAIQKVKSGHNDHQAVSLAANGIFALHSGSELPLPVLDLAAESLRMSEFLARRSQEHAKEQKQKELASVLKRIQSHHGVFRAKNGRKFILPEKYLDMFLEGKVSAVLIAGDPAVTEGLKAADYDNLYVTIRDRQSTGKSIDSALELFRKVQDPYLLRILEEMFGIHNKTDAELKKFIPPVHLNQLRDAIRESYSEHISPLKKIWFTLTGKQISDREVQNIRSGLQESRIREAEARKNRKSAGDKKSARKAVKERARQKPAGEDPDTGVEVKRVKAAAGLEDKMQDTLLELIEYANAVWDRNAFPDKVQLLSLLPKEKRAEAETVLGFVDAGAASASAMVRIPVTGKGSVYASREYLQQHRQELLEKFNRKIDSSGGFSRSDAKSITSIAKEQEMDVLKSLVKYLSQMQ